MNGRVDFEKYNNDWYRKEIRASRVKQLLWYFINGLFFVNPLNFSSGLKVFFLRAFGARMGKKVIVKPGVNVKYPWLLTVGDNSWIGESVWIDNLTDVTIGANVCLSQGSMLLTGNHNYKKPAFDLIVKGIVLEDGVWIGAKAMVCPGVICYSHSILTACSVATSDMEAYQIYQGNPAAKVRQRTIAS